MLSLKVVGGLGGGRSQKECHLPPFIKADEAVMIHVDFIKEASKSSFGDCETCLAESCFKFFSSHLAIVVAIN